MRIWLVIGMVLVAARSGDEWSTEQTLYFDTEGMLKRHDYNVEVGGNSPAAHYVSEPKVFSGIVFPTKRRVFPRQPDGQSMPEPLIVSIDLDNFVLR